MPTPTYDLIASTTLAASTSEVVFSSLPSSYRDLILIMNGKATASGSGSRLRLNGDTGGNYSLIRMYGYTGGTGSDSASGVGYFDISAMNTSDGNIAIMQFMDYSASDKQKTVLFRNQESGLSAVLANAGRWANTAAITSINVFAGSDNFASGSTFNLFGVIS